MQQASQQTQPWCHFVAPKPVFKIFIASENQRALLQARQVRDQIESLCGKEADVSTTYWNFALLQNDNLRARAAAEAADAEMIIISLGGGREFPSHVLDWVEIWPARPQPGQALLVTLGCARQETGARCHRQVQFFRQTAAKLGLDFLCDYHREEPVNFKSSASFMHVTQSETRDSLSDGIAWCMGGITE